MNKYEQIPDRVIDLHGYTTAEVEGLLDDLTKHRDGMHVRIITGKGNHSRNGAVLNAFVKNYLDIQSIRYNQAKIQDGGEGALEVFIS